MTYLVSQIIIAILLAALLGFGLGWWVRGRRSARSDVESVSAAAPPGDSRS